MSTTFFTPVRGTPLTVARASQTVSLDRARYVIRGLYTHPFTGALVPLPPHAWVLYSVDVGALGSSPPSDDAGATRITSVTKPSSGDGFANLLLFPLPRVPPPRTDAALEAAFFASGLDKYGYGRTLAEDAGRDHEVWLDWDRNEWVSARQLAFPETRRLLRFPVWTSHDKSRAGGFKPAGDPKLALFEEGGLLDTINVEQVGTPSAPWDIVLDFGWVRSFVQFRYYNRARGKLLSVPAGLVVRSRYDDPGHSGQECGGGAGIVDDPGGGASTCVLHAATRFQLDALNYRFETPGRAIVDLQDEKVTPADPRADDRSRSRATRYALPQLWHARGMESLEDGRRAAWPSHRGADTSPASPLAFCLDDAVLVDTSGTRVTPVKGEPITALDAVLAVRALPDDKRIPARNYLAGEDYVFDLSASAPSGGEVGDRATLLVYYDGRFFDLREHRARGTPGVDDAIGARAAVEMDPDCHAMQRFRPENAPLGDVVEAWFDLHVITEAASGSFYDGNRKRVTLHHVLVHAPCVVRTHDTSKLVSAADVQRLEGLIREAEWRWSHTHPALPAAPIPPSYVSPKEYNIVAEDGAVADDDPVFKARYFFPIHGQAQKATESNLDRERVNVHLYPTDKDIPEDQTQHTVDNQVFISVSGMDRGAMGTVGDDPDGASFASLPQRSVAHELGHICGLPDEYNYKLVWTEAVDDILTKQPSPPKMFQPFTGNIFQIDAYAEMNQNTFGRLRYQWHAAQMVSAMPGPVARVTGGKRFVPEHTQMSRGDGRVRYLPQDNPWVPVRPAPKPPDAGVWDVRVHAIGTDEGTLKWMFEDVTADPFDSIVVVSTSMWFDFNPAPADLAGHQSAMQTARALHDGFYFNANAAIAGISLAPQAALRKGQRFQIRSPSGPLRRAAVMMEIQLAYGPLPPPEGWTRFQANVALLVDDAGPRDLLDPAFQVPQRKSGRQVHVSSADVSFGLLRFLLRVPHRSGAGLDDAPLSPADFVHVLPLAGFDPATAEVSTF